MIKNCGKLFASIFNMKKGGIILVLFISVFIFSCQKEDTGVPSNNTSGDSRESFIGNWNCKESSQINGSSNYIVNITKSSTNTFYIHLNNFYNFGITPYAEINGDNFIIPTQTLSGNVVSGSGSIIGNSTINMVYSVNDGYVIDNVTAVLTK